MKLLFPTLSHPLPTLLTCLACLAPSQLLAQTYSVVPQIKGTDYAKVSGEGTVTSGLSDLYSRNMEIFHKSSIGFVAGKIQEIAFRPWRKTNAYYHRRDFTIRMGMTQQSPSNLPFHFDKIPAKPLVTVYQGKMNLPSFLATPRQLTPWLAVFKLQKPFVYATPLGHLVVDIESTTTATTNFLWERDARFAHYDSTPGKERTLGPGCKGSNGLAMRTWPYNLSLAVPGKTMPIFMMQALSTNVFAFNFLGFSNSSPYPIDLTPFGMTGCKLYTNLDMVQVVKLGEASKNGMRGIAYWPLPKRAALTGVKLNTQWFQLDKNANLVGLTTSQGVEITIGSPGKREFMVQSLWSYTTDHRGQANQSSYEYGAIMRIMR